MSQIFSLTLEDLPTPTLKRFFADYEAAAPDGLPPRHRQLLPWCWRASEHLMLTMLPEPRAHELIETNLLGIVLNVMVDDLADLVSDEATLLEAALQILSQGDSADEASDKDWGSEVDPKFADYLTLLARLRRELMTRTRRAPAYDAWRHELARFLGRFQTAMRMSSAWNRRWQSQVDPEPKAPAFDVFTDRMAPPIHSYVYGLMNLMQLDAGASSEREAITSVLRCGEQFLAMSNWLATWKFEVAEQDFTSGVIAWALECGALSADELRTQLPQSLIDKLEGTGAESAIEQAMNLRLKRLRVSGASVSAFDTEAYRRSLEQVHIMHQSFKGVLKT